MGVRTDVPFRDLTAQEKDIVFHGPAEKKHILYHAKNSNQAGELDFTYLQRRLHRGKRPRQGQGREGHEARGEVFEGGGLPGLRRHAPVRCGPRAAAARHPARRGLHHDAERAAWSGCAAYRRACPRRCVPWRRASARRSPPRRGACMDLGLGYLALDRSAATLSTGERQRMQLARAVRNRTTGVLYVLDEPSIGLHPSNIVGLTGVMHDLVADGNSVAPGRPRHADSARSRLDRRDGSRRRARRGGHVIAEGPVAAIAARSRLADRPVPRGAQRRGYPPARGGGRSCSQAVTIRLSTGGIHTVKPLEVDAAEGAAHGCDGRLRLGQDDDGAREPRPRAAGADRRRAPPRPRQGAPRGGHPRTSSSSTRRPSG